MSATTSHRREAGIARRCTDRLQEDWLRLLACAIAVGTPAAMAFSGPPGPGTGCEGMSASWRSIVGYTATPFPTQALIPVRRPVEHVRRMMMSHWTRHRAEAPTAEVNVAAVARFSVQTSGGLPAVAGPQGEPDCFANGCAVPSAADDEFLLSPVLIEETGAQRQYWVSRQFTVDGQPAEVSASYAIALASNGEHATVVKVRQDVLVLKAGRRLLFAPHRFRPYIDCDVRVDPRLDAWSLHAVARTVRELVQAGDVSR